MRFTELLQPADVVLPLEVSDKWDAIASLMRHLTDAERIPEAASKELHEQVLVRERSMSTGMERGIAIPHAAVDALDSVVACLGVVTRDEGLPFDSIDARPTQFVVLLLIPREQKLQHIRTLADIARLLGRADVRTELLGAESGPAAFEILKRSELE